MCYFIQTKYYCKVSLLKTCAGNSEVNHLVAGYGSFKVLLFFILREMFLMVIVQELFAVVLPTLWNHFFFMEINVCG